MNTGNSPNSDECSETDDDEGLCEAYAKINRLEKERDAALAACAEVKEVLEVVKFIHKSELQKLIDAYDTYNRYARTEREDELNHKALTDAVNFARLIVGEESN